MLVKLILPGAFNSFNIAIRKWKPMYLSHILFLFYSRSLQCARHVLDLRDTMVGKARYFHCSYGTGYLDLIGREVFMK